MNGSQVANVLQEVNQVVSLMATIFLEQSDVHGSMVDASDSCMQLALGFVESGSRARWHCLAEHTSRHPKIANENGGECTRVYRLVSVLGLVEGSLSSAGRGEVIRYEVGIGS